MFYKNATLVIIIAETKQQASEKTWSSRWGKNQLDSEMEISCSLSSSVWGSTVVTSDTSNMICLLTLFRFWSSNENSFVCNLSPFHLNTHWIHDRSTNVHKNMPKYFFAIKKNYFFHIAFNFPLFTNIGTSSWKLLSLSYEALFTDFLWFKFNRNLIITP